MNGDRQFERNLPGILADLGAGPAPDYTDLLLARTGGSRQRPAWVFPERWLPMDTVARPAASTRLPSLRLVALVGSALLLVGAIVAIALVAGSRRELPPAFGLAGNGLVAWAEAGRIVVADPIALTTKVVATGEVDRPRFSPDGTKIAYLRPTGLLKDIVVMNPDGTEPAVVTTKPIPALQFFEWAPDSKGIVISQAPTRLIRLDAARPAEPTVLVSNLADPLGDWNNQVNSIFRPPEGDEILYLALEQGRVALFVAASDGSDARAIVDRTDLEYGEIIRPSWSPDGSTIAFNANPPNAQEPYRTYLVNADGTGLRGLAPAPDHVTDGMPVWSPDGRSIVMQRWVNTPTGVDIRPLQVVDVTTDEIREVGEVSPNGFLSYGWSPDGKSIIAVPDASHEVHIVDVETGEVRSRSLIADSGVTWQRVTP